MATNVWYDIRIDGRLKGNKNSTVNKAALADFRKIMLPKPKPGQSGTAWPQGFLFKHVSFRGDAGPWDIDVYNAGTKNTETKINFVGVIGGFLGGSVHGNRRFLAQLNKSLVDYRRQTWFLDLMAKLDKLNTKYAGHFIDRFYVRQWESGFSDGGDM